MTEETVTTVTLVSSDAALTAPVAAGLGAMARLAVETVDGALTDTREAIAARAPDILVADIDTAGNNDLAALAELSHTLKGATTIIAIVPSLDPAAVRALFQYRIADLMVRPVDADDVIGAVLRAADESDAPIEADATIHTFLPAAGGVGNTTLALEAAALLVRRGSTCIVDLNLQSGSCAEYLDLAPGFDLAEVEKNPDRLDRQLLDAMIARHRSGIAVVAAPPDPASIGMSDPVLVARILDLAAAHFQNVVIDMPRTWLPWTDSVLLGSDVLFIVAELSAPCLRQVQRLANAIVERTGGDIAPRIIVNRVPRRRQSRCLTVDDARAVLGDRFAGSVANQYDVVRQAIDRGVPLREVSPKNAISGDLRRIVMPDDDKSGSLFSLFRHKTAA